MTDNLAGVVKTTFEVNLDIPNIQIEQVEVDREGHYRMTVHSTDCGTSCHKCGHFIVTFLVKTPAFRRERLQSLRTLKCQPVRILDYHDRVQQKQLHGFSPPLSPGVDYEISIPGLARRLAAARSHGYRASGRRNERSYCQWRSVV